jgi:prepilin-type N-terminal cleavage/methylation domain-containing protein
MASPLRARPGRARAGFTLIELALVIAIVGLMLGAILVPLASQLDQRQYRQTERDLEDIRRALLGFAVVHGRLPCPDTKLNPDGQEVAPCVGADVEVGALPWQTLGVSPADAWGRIYRYAVTAAFTLPAVPGAIPGAGRLDLQDQGAITVFGRDQGPGVEHDRTTTAVAVVLSFGANGAGGRTLAGDSVAAPPAGTDEAINAASPVDFRDDPRLVARNRSVGGAGCSDTNPMAAIFCEFDDLVVWLSTPRVLGELVSAGRLP